MDHERGARCPHPRSRGFTLIDLLTSIAVMSLLMAILLPSLSSAYESARRVQCASNLRQIGLALHMYADDFRGALPPSVFDGAPDQPQEMVALRLDKHPRVGDAVQWDGLGILYELRYIGHPSVFYCPSHHGFHDYTKYAGDFVQPTGEIVGNYQYRYGDRLRARYLSDLSQQSAMLADGLRSQPEFSHEVGMNRAIADGSVHWLEDHGRTLFNAMPLSETSPTGSIFVGRTWGWLDHGQVPQFAGFLPTPPPPAN